MIIIQKIIRIFYICFIIILSNNDSYAQSIFDLTPYGSEGVTKSESDGVLRISIKGKIDNLTYERFSILSIEAPLKKDFIIDLDSEGGDVDSAIKIGRIIRKNEGTTIIRNNCLSSCALIFIAGVIREYMFGELGLHRPYIASVPNDPEETKRIVYQTIQKIKLYISDMNVSDEFFNIVMNTPPSEIRKFGYRFESLSTILPKIDYVYDEVQTARDSERYRITTDEFRRRDAVQQKECGKIYSDPNIPVTAKIIQVADCKESILWGIPLEKYEALRMKLLFACPLADSDAEKLKKMSKNEKFTSEIVKKKNQCEQKIFLD